MNKPSRNEVKTSHKLWAQYIDANCTQSEFNAMNEARKDSWLNIFNY